MRLPWFGRRDSELDEEIRHHLAMAARDRVETGESPQQASQNARLEFGNLGLVKEVTREMWGHGTFDRLAQDLRYATRTLLKDRSFSAVAIAVLALGIGMNTAIFSIVDGVVLRPMPFTAPARLVAVDGTSLSNEASFDILRRGSKLVEYSTYSNLTQVNLTGEGTPARLSACPVGGNFFNVLDARPFLGRTFRPNEDSPGRNRLAILSYGLWQTRFHGDPSVVGRSVHLGESIREVVGVMPPDFRFPSAEAQLWIPLNIDPIQDGDYWWGFGLTIIGRLHPGADRSQAQAELLTFIPRIRAGFPWKMWPDWGAGTTLATLQDYIAAGVRKRFLIVLGSVGLVMLIACANVANLLLSRAVNRHKEIAMRTVLGASRTRVIRQLLTESLTLALIGGFLGLGLAFGGVVLLKSLLPADTPRLADAAINLRVLAFTGALCVLTGLLFGVVPALTSSRTESQAWRSGDRSIGGGTRRRLSATLVTFEVAIAIVVVIGAGLLAKSLWLLIHVDPGFRTGHLLTARVTPNESLCKDPARCTAFYNELLSRLHALPGVEDASAAAVLPLDNQISGFAAEFEGHPVLPGHPAPTVFANTITPGYLQTMGIPLLSGRAFTDQDTATTLPVALISAATAQRWWPGQNPIGKHLKRVWLKEWITIIGVTGDVKEMSLGRPSGFTPEGDVYFPYAQDLRAGMSLAIRTAVPPLQFSSPLQSMISAMQPDVPVTKIRTMDEIVSSSLLTPRSTLWLLGTFAMLAVLLGAVGLYGVISYDVTRRTREIGIRLALGARPRDVRWSVLGRTLALTAIGLIIGLSAAAGSVRVMRSLLYGVSTSDPSTFIVSAAFLLAIAGIAGYLPARRAARVDPVTALRYE
ncbi:MAG TPA: ABC transporter permease [Bryobacteraceae bacterium]|nr:ABC transporter permease [Bryobacteraceae bacterium]